MIRLALATMFVQKAREFFLHARMIAGASERPRTANDVALQCSWQLAPLVE